MANMTNLNIRRVATQKVGLADFVVPDMPVLPDDVLRRFPTMVEWQMGMKKWRNDLQSQLRRIPITIKDTL